MTYTNSFRTNEDYYRRLFGRRKVETPSVPNAVIDNASQNLGAELSYSLIPSEDYAKTYGLALEALRQSKAGIDQKHLITINGTEYVRPLSFKETLEARLNAYNSGADDEEKMLLLNAWLRTSTGIAYPPKDSPNANKFKIIPVCNQLITLDSAFNDEYLTTPYDSLHEKELDKTSAKYNKLLTKSEVKSHPAWLAAVEGDKELLKDYADLIFSLKPKDDKLMRFWLANPEDSGHLRALVVYSIDYYSDADGNYSLNDLARFVRVAHSRAPQAQSAKK